MLEVPQCIASVHKSTKHFDFHFAYDAPNIWNDLPDNVCSPTSLFYFIKTLKSDLFARPYNPVLDLFLILSYIFCVVLTSACVSVYFIHVFFLL